MRYPSMSRRPPRRPPTTIRARAARRVAGAAPRGAPGPAPTRTARSARGGARPGAAAHPAGGADGRLAVSCCSPRRVTVRARLVGAGTRRRHRGAVDDKRRLILDQALALVDERGLAAMSMRAVAERVGLTSMALYPYVGGKDALLDGLVALLHLELGTAVGADLAEIDWRRRLHALGRAVRG